MKLNISTVRIVSVLILLLWLIYFFGAQVSFIGNMAHELISNDSFLKNIHNKSDSNKTAYAYFRLGERLDERAIENALIDTNSTVPAIRLHSILYLADLNQKEAIPHLIRLLLERHNTSQAQLFDYLKILSKQNLQNDPQIWKNWWNHNNPEKLIL